MTYIFAHNNSAGKILHSFLYKNLFCRNVEAWIGQNFKNMLRTYPGWDFVNNVFTLYSYLYNKLSYVRIKLSIVIWSELFTAYLNPIC